MNIPVYNLYGRSIVRSAVLFIASFAAVVGLLYVFVSHRSTHAEGVPTSDFSTILETLPVSDLKAVEGAVVARIKTEGPALDATTPYSLTCAEPGLDDAAFKIGGALHDELLLSRNESAPHNQQEGVNFYTFCIRTMGANGDWTDTSFTAPLVHSPRVSNVSFNVTASGKKLMTMTGSAFALPVWSGKLAFYRSMVQLNNTDLKFCASPFGATAQEIIEVASPNYPDVAQNITDDQPCYYFIADEAGADLTPTSATVWLPDTFDETARGTVSVNGSPLYTFNASNGGETPIDPTASVDGTKPLDQHPIIKPLPTFSGVATPGATITVTVHSDPVTCTTTADENGNWSCTLPQTLPAGEHTVYVQVTNPDSSIENLGPYAVTVAQNGTSEPIDNTTPTAPNTGVASGILGLIGVGVAAVIVALGVLGIIRLNRASE